ncbi:ComF family protein [Noviherbaspirillum cavernae]|uniref:ComF family protein n=1 Tax=Noviherbaspirillum cavernae TaxID=2320862 RepID=A0A418WXK9_9BURK|nr:ComF family protein [Noviherbaspirillum cavernae]RJG04956.1 ComF family protein [Noviherbaspirillum cavernae]
MLFRLRDWPQRIAASLSMLIPGSCALCGEAGSDSLCAGCHAQFFSKRAHRCRQCASRLPTATADSAAVCGECLKNPPAFDATIVAADYAPPIDQLVLALKFGNRLALAPLFARMLHNTAMDAALPTRLTAVPLGSQRLAERGFNQALEIARPLSRALGVKLDAKLVSRLRDTRAQALLHPDERHRNVRRAFIVPDHAIDRVRGQHVGVIDDVITTGETLNEIAATLKRFGATRVTNFVFARTLQK